MPPGNSLFKVIQSLWLTKVKPFVINHLLWIKANYFKLKNYYATHPKQKRWTIAGLLVMGPPLLLLLIVWIEIPGKKALRNIQNQLPSEIYSADSVLIGRFFVQDRTEVKFDQIAQSVKDALIATEDIRFYEHGGVDFESLGRVLTKSIIMGDESAGGGSTLTQQLSKNLYPRKKYWMLSMLINKLREMWTAIRIEDIYNKDQILTMYLNTVSFADQTYGIETASKRFFSVSAKDLKTEQAALLVGMLKATHSYNPRLFPDRALKRRNVVIGQMVKYNFLKKEEADKIQEKPLALRYSRPKNNLGLASYFKEYVRTELQKWFDEHPNEEGENYNIYTDGLKIYTTIDSRMQTYAEKAVEQQMTELQKQFFAHWGKEGLFKENKTLLSDAIKRSDRYKKLVEEGLTEDEIVKKLEKKIPIRLFSWQGEKEVIASPIDSIKHHLQFLNAGFLVLDAHNGQIKAWVGGIDHQFFQYDHVRTSTKRQVGSIFKPLVYATAIDKGISPCELVSANRETYIDEEGEEWTPRNSNIDYEVKYTMRGALAYSVNTVAVKMIMKAGVNETKEVARKMGIESELPDVPSIALGSPSVSLMEMTQAFSGFTNEGETVKPMYVTKVVDVKGNMVKDLPQPEKTQPSLSKKAIALTREMMRTVTQEGTASRIRWKYGVYTELAGKTGTTQGNADGWFMAVTPDLVIGSWVGADDQRVRFRHTELGQGASTALPIAGYFLKQVNADKKFKKLAEATFNPLPGEWRKELECDLYELDSALIRRIEKVKWKRDSTLLADTTATIEESFLEQLLKRKQKMLQYQMRQDSIRRRDLINVLENETETNNDN